MGFRVTIEMLAGRDPQALVTYPQQNAPSVNLHGQVAKQFTILRQVALQNDYDIRIISAYRSYSRQLEIWNGKVNGTRSVLDKDGIPLNLALMTQQEKVFAILRWSAFPGGSRHHWGTDLDVIDANGLPESYQLKLTPEEFSDTGIFGSFRQWLDDRITTQESAGFFRPYAEDRGGVSPEPWHLSYAPLAKEFQQRLSKTDIKVIVENSNMLLKDVVVDNFDEIYERFVCVPDGCYPS